MSIQEAIKSAEQAIEKGDPGLAAGILRGYPETKEDEDLLRMLSLGQYGCHKNDLLPTIKRLKELYE